MYFGFSLLTQVESALLVLHPPSAGWQPLLGFLAFLPFRQLEHAAFASGVGVAIALLCRGRAGRLLCTALLSALLLYQVFDQIAYRAFLAHFEWSMLEGAPLDVARLAGSVAAETGPVLALNLTLWLSLSVWLARRLWREPQGPTGALLVPATRTTCVALAGFVALSVAATWQTPGYGLERPALVVLVESVVRDKWELPEVVDADPALYRLRFGAPTSRPDDAQRLQSWFEAMRSAHDRPNIVLVILESVGSQQLLPNGRLSPIVTPRLAALEPNSAAFDQLYNAFPASMRGNLPINTGGRTITWASFTEALATQYRGPLLVKSLADRGYRTALMSAGFLNTENMDRFYAAAGYDIVYEPRQEDEAFVAARKVHSWGIDEDAVRERAMRWIDEAPADPFFLQLLTISTHHPYGGPKTHRGPIDADSSEARYYNALHHTDAVLGRLMDDLETRGLLDRTLIFLCGDHGQAFGTRHPRNFFHQAFLYEENVRNFLLVLAPGRTSAGVRASRVGSTGDIMPTIVGIAGGNPGDVPGQNLFSRGYEERVVFFHKNVSPAKWGLRDGRWKFIARPTGLADAELYDLVEDPGERRNVADQYPERLAAYQRACRQWFVETNQAFLAEVPGVDPGGQLTPRDLRVSGPKAIRFGSRGKSGEFTELARVNPREDLVAWTRWMPYGQEKRIVYRWVAPDGRESLFSVRLPGDWGETWVHHELVEPMQPGTWRLVLAEGERELLTASFVVDPSAPLITEIDPTLEARRQPIGRR